jgi:hypothetical protein
MRRRSGNEHRTPDPLAAQPHPRRRRSVAHRCGRSHDVPRGSRTHLHPDRHDGSTDSRLQPGTAGAVVLRVATAPRRRQPHVPRRVPQRPASRSRGGRHLPFFLLREGQAGPGAARDGAARAAQIEAAQPNGIYAHGPGAGLSSLASAKHSTKQITLRDRRGSAASTTTRWRSGGLSTATEIARARSAPARSYRTKCGAFRAKG